MCDCAYRCAVVGYAAQLLLSLSYIGGAIVAVAAFYRRRYCRLHLDWLVGISWLTRSVPQRRDAVWWIDVFICNRLFELFCCFLTKWRLGVCLSRKETGSGDCAAFVEGVAASAAAARSDLITVGSVRDTVPPLRKSH